LFLKPLGLGAKFKSAPNPSGLRRNPNNIVNRTGNTWKSLGKPVFGGQATLFVRRPLVQIAPFDVELNSAHHPNGFRNKPSSKANPNGQNPAKY